MSTLNFIITDAGRQAAINASTNGLQLSLTKIAYGTGNWSPDKTATTLRSKFKELVAGGKTQSPLYVHVAVTDQSSQTYQANEIGVYAGSVLFAIWSKGLQPSLNGPGKTSSGDSAFVFDLLLTNVPAGSVTVGDANFSVPIATSTKRGIILDAPNDGRMYVRQNEQWQIMHKYDIGFIGDFGTNDLPAGFLPMNGTRVTNGMNEPLYKPIRDKCLGTFLTQDGNDFTTLDMPDFKRGKGSSGRSVGSFEGDAIRNITGTISTSNGWIYLANQGVFERFGGLQRLTVPNIAGVYSVTPHFKFDASRVVPTASENRPKSHTVNFGIYTGVGI